MEVLLLRMKKVQIDPLLHFPLNQNMCLHVQSHTRVGNASDLHRTVRRVLLCLPTCHGTNNSLCSCSSPCRRGAMQWWGAGLLCPTLGIPSECKEGENKGRNWVAVPVSTLVFTTNSSHTALIRGPDHSPHSRALQGGPEHLIRNWEHFICALSPYGSRHTITPGIRHWGAPSQQLSKRLCHGSPEGAGLSPFPPPSAPSWLYPWGQKHKHLWEWTCVEIKILNRSAEPYLGQVKAGGACRGMADGDGPLQLWAAPAPAVKVYCSSSGYSFFAHFILSLLLSYNILF